MLENKCEPKWNGNEYINCKKCIVKDECSFYQELTKGWYFYSENGDD